MTMPGDGLGWQDGKSLWGPQLSKAVLNGSVPIDRLNDMVTRVIASWYQLGQDDETKFPREPPNFSSWTDEKMGIMSPGSRSPQETVEVNKFVNVQSNHSIIARQVAAEAIVMLKNENTLPISRQGIPDGEPGARHITHLQTHRKRQVGKLKIGVFGEDAGPGKGPNYCKDRGCNQGTLGSGWGSGAVEFPYLIPPVEALRAGFDDSKIELHEYLTNSPPLSGDPSVLDELEVCIVFANADSGEGFLSWSSIAGDRNDLFLQKGGDDLIVEIAERCGAGHGDTVVVIHSVGPVLMERWIDMPSVKAVLLANLPGEESGNALADIIFGDVNPSGRLPYTVGRSLEDYGPGAKVMYLPNGAIPQQDFSEGLYIDYRYFDKYEISPRFEFGFGLSYTTFEFSNTQVSPVKSKTALPSPRPKPGATPPEFGKDIPDGKEALFPEGIRKLDNYVYPYLDNTDQLVYGRYPYPDGYDIVRPPSGAGGEEGGNPDLWETYLTVHVDVKNTGTRAGKAVAQLYIAYPQSSPGSRGTEIDFPEKVLRGFEKIYLEQGETRTVEFKLTRRDLSYWDVNLQNWVIAMKGQYTFMVGESSRNVHVAGRW
jgi:beta-glucosidase